MSSGVLVQELQAHEGQAALARELAHDGVEHVAHEESTRERLLTLRAGFGVTKRVVGGVDEKRKGSSAVRLAIDEGSRQKKIQSGIVRTHGFKRVLGNGRGPESPFGSTLIKSGEYDGNDARQRLV